MRYNAAEKKSLEFLELLPKIDCLSPRAALKQMTSQPSGMYHEYVYRISIQCNFGSTDRFKVTADSKVFRSHQFQRVYQYLSRYSAQQSLDNFNFTGKIEGEASNCLELLLRYVLRHNV